MKSILLAAICLLCVDNCDSACPNLCNNNGLCGINNVCICHEGFTGPDCSRRKSIFLYVLFYFSILIIYLLGLLQVFALMGNLGLIRQPQLTPHMRILSALVQEYVTPPVANVIVLMGSLVMRVNEVSHSTLTFICACLAYT